MKRIVMLFAVLVPYFSLLTFALGAVVVWADVPELFQYALLAGGAVLIVATGDALVTKVLRRLS